MKKIFKPALLTLLLCFAVSLFSSCILWLPTDYDSSSSSSSSSKGTVKIYNRNTHWNSYIQYVDYWNGTKWVECYKGEAYNYCSFKISSGYQDFRITEIYPDYYRNGDGAKYYYTRTHGDSDYSSDDFVYGSRLYVPSGSTLTLYIDGADLWKN